ncbi:MAG: hypothetical protein N3G76_02845 [Candidatus Micrarchaeota archaeon]|nr:hypothetical protein [Candidatus Micrarchaeota archaeon]
MRRGQIFIQDVSVSLAISIITVLSLVAFLNFSSVQFENAVRAVHMQAVIDRVIDKLLVSGDYQFSTHNPFSVKGGFAGFVRSLNNEDEYEKFRDELSLGREGVAYDAAIELSCDDGTHITGGRKGSEHLKKTVLVMMEGNICTADVAVSKR